MGLGRGSKQDKVATWFVNEGQKTVFMIVYFALNFLFFFIVFQRYRQNEVLFRVLGHGVTVARGSAAALNFNCAMLLLPVCRNFNTWLRGTFVAGFIPLEKNIRLHKTIAYLIALFSASHTLAHHFNYYYLTSAPNSPKTPYHYAFMTVPGITGHLICWIMVLMYAASMNIVKNQCFELFWFSHQMFILFYALVISHGAAGTLQPTSLWLWVLGPLALYMFERLVRAINGSVKTEVLRIVQHPSMVFEIQLQRGKGGSNEYRAGQYIFLNCASVAKQEWHAMTVTSSPEEDYISCHIRIAGDWSRGVANYLGLRWDKDGKCLDTVEGASQTVGQAFRFDGPFGTATEEAFNYETAILVGAGIGVTPFASLLKSIWYKVQDGQQANMKLKKVYFFWIARDRASFEWFTDLLGALERENLGDFIDIRVYLTQQMKESEVRDMMFDKKSAGGAGVDSVTGLRAPTNFGRPNWEDVFRELSQTHQGHTQGVFLCGPKNVAGTLRRLCRKYTVIRGGTGTKFIFHKENF